MNSLSSPYKLLAVRALSLARILQGYMKIYNAATCSSGRQRVVTSDWNSKNIPDHERLYMPAWGVRKPFTFTRHTRTKGTSDTGTFGAWGLVTWLRCGDAGIRQNSNDNMWPGLVLAALELLLSATYYV